MHACGSAPTRPDSSAPGRAALAERKGDVVAGRWVLREKIGQGGGGAVYRAWDRELEVEVAIKALPAGDLHEGLVRRFKREIRLTREIDHPNVSRVFELLESDGATFLTMRLLAGQPLHLLVQRAGPLPRAALGRLADGLVAALAAAHRKGIVHRDLKPSNVMVAPDGQPVLLDFGVAKELRGEGEESDRITPRGTAPGTPAFMPPEQLRGDEVLPASDVYALARTIAFAATGASEKPADPARALVALPRPLRALLVRSLDDSIGARPTDAVAIERALERAARRRRRLGLVGSGVAAVGLALALASLAARRAEERAVARTPAVSVAPLVNRTGDRSLAWLEHGVADLVSAALESDGRVRLVPRDAPLRVEGTIVRERDGVSVRIALRRGGGRVLCRDTVREATGPALFDGVDHAVERILAALGVSRRRAAPKAPAVTIDPEAFADFARAEDEIRVYHMESALDSLRSATARDRGFALAWLELSILAGTREMGSRAEADAALALAGRHRDRLPPSQRELLERIVDREAPGGAERLRAYLRSHTADGAAYRMAATMNAFRDPASRRALLEEWAARIPDDPEAHNQLGYTLLLDFHDHARAERELHRYLDLAPNAANAHDSWGELLAAEGRTAEAIAAFGRALSIDPTFSVASVHAVEAAVVGADADAAAEWAARSAGAPPRELRDFVRWVRAQAAVPLLADDREGALRRLGEIAADPTIGSRAYVAREYEAVVRGLAGDARGAATAAADADRLARLYHGEAGALASLGPYVAGLVGRSRRDAAGLARAAASLDEAGLDPLRGHRRDFLAALSVAESDPSGAAERLRSVDPWNDGLAFLAAFERALLLARAGRTDEVARAVEVARDRRRPVATSAEAASIWPELVRAFPSER